jgi:hypothetical protein
MEPLVFATIAMLRFFKEKETYVAEPAEFRHFDLRSLHRRQGGRRALGHLSDLTRVQPLFARIDKRFQ